MTREAMRLEELVRINTMTTLEAVAYANRLSNRLKSDNCTDEERQNGADILARLSERVSFLKIALEPPAFCRIVDILPDRVDEASNQICTWAIPFCDPNYREGYSPSGGGVPVQ